MELNATLFKQAKAWLFKETKAAEALKARASVQLLEQKLAKDAKLYARQKEAESLAPWAAPRRRTWRSCCSRRSAASRRPPPAQGIPDDRRRGVPLGGGSTRQRRWRGQHDAAGVRSALGGSGAGRHASAGVDGRADHQRRRHGI
jgi:hypothetical protein